MNKVVNSTQFQQRITMVGEDGQEESLLVQPGGRVDLPPGYSVHASLPRGVYYFPETHRAQVA